MTTTILDRVAQLRDQLAAEVDALREYAEQRKAEADLAAQQFKRVERALRDLDGPGETKPAAKPKGDKVWAPKQDKMDAVLAALRELNEPASVPRIAKAAGLSDETARRALVALREGNQARLTGVSGGRGGGARLYASMPNGDHASAD